MWQFGEVLATTEHEEAIIIAEIDYSILEQRRFTFLQTTISCICLTCGCQSYQLIIMKYYCDLITQDKSPCD
jgi:hypothetical protein